ncbi:MAG: alpha/beta fold hydrolase [Cyanobacteria bacterium RI_101]|nr:alpha/beta fold hydrolase [Cyanobacteria bacterium RI_101]
MLAGSDASTPVRAPQIWHWRGYPIAYQRAGETGPAIVLVHGFGACWGHWRRNLPALGQECRVFALDLIGFGASAKPQPGGEIDYTFAAWSQLLADFCREVVGEPAFLIGNSIGCVVIFQTAVDAPLQVRGLAALNCSLRLLHDRKRQSLPWYRQWGAPVLQQILANRAIGQFFFKQIARPGTVKKILRQAYVNPDAVTDELVDLLLAPAQDPGAMDVFLAFTRYSQGPLPEDLLPQITCPTLFLWGEKDPWEPLALGRRLAEYPCVEDFIVLPNVGHCPQDEAPEQVNPLLLNWIRRHC